MRIGRHRALLAAVLVIFAAGLLSVPGKLAATRAGAPSTRGQTAARYESYPGAAARDRSVQVPRPVSTARPDEVAIAPPPVVFDAPAEAPAPPPAQLTAAPVAPFVNNGVFAVVVGINDYPGQSADLASAVADADDMDAALERFAVPLSNRLVLRDRQASAATIVAAVDWLSFVAGPDATVVIFYAGHVRKLAASTEAIVAADGELVTDQDLADHMAALRTTDVWLMMASCFGGGFTEPLVEGRILTAAADANSLAYENRDFGRSYMAEFLVRQALLEGKSAATAEEAFAYAQTALAGSYPDRMLTQVDQSTEPLALDGQHHDPVTPTVPAPSPPTTAPPPDPPPPPPADPPAPPPDDCRRVMLLFCSKH